jgi:CRP/FNR family cyclic AMP-dependent transcriptional regulator
MSSAYIYQLLKGLGLDESCVLKTLRRVKMTAFDTGEVIWPKGGQVAAWTYIVSGLVGASVPLQEGGCIQVNVYGRRTWFGEEALLNRYPSCLEYACLTPVRAVSIPAEDTLAAFHSEPDFSRYIALLMAWRSRQHSEMIVLMKQASPPLRVIMGLAMFAEALNYNSSRPPTHGLEGPSLEIPVKQSVVASVCGVSRGVFSELVQHLAAAGWLRVNYATLELRSSEAWLRFSRTQRQARMNITKPTLEELLLLMEEAARV